MDKLTAHLVGYVIDYKLSVFRRNLRMKNHLQQNVAQLLAKKLRIFGINGLNDLIRFLNKVIANAFVRLLTVPRATALAAKELHDLYKIRKAICLLLKNPDGTVAAEVTPANPFQILILSAPELAEGNYTLWSGDTQFEGMAGQSGGPGGHFGGAQIIERPEWPGKGEGGDVEIPPQPTNPVVTHGTVQPPATGEQPADMPVAQFPEGSQGQMPVPPMPQEGGNMPMPQLPGGVTPPADGFQGKPSGGMTILTGVLSTDFPVTTGANYYMDVKPVE